MLPFLTWDNSRWRVEGGSLRCSGPDDPASGTNLYGELTLALVFRRVANPALPSVKSRTHGERQQLLHRPDVICEASRHTCTCAALGAVQVSPACVTHTAAWGLLAPSLLWHILAGATTSAGGRNGKSRRPSVGTPANTRDTCACAQCRLRRELSRAV